MKIKLNCRFIILTIGVMITLITVAMPCIHQSTDLLNSPNIFLTSSIIAIQSIKLFTANYQSLLLMTNFHFYYQSSFSCPNYILISHQYYIYIYVCIYIYIYICLPNNSSSLQFTECCNFSPIYALTHQLLHIITNQWIYSIISQSNHQSVPLLINAVFLLVIFLSHC